MSQPSELEAFQAARLFASDVDNTQMLSFERSPHGIGVEEAYRAAISVIYGQAAINHYNTNGGHNNRTPAEIATNLVPFVKSGEVFQQVTLLSELDYPVEDIVQQLGLILPSKKSICADDLSPQEIAATAQLLTDLKLQKLISQVGLALPDGGYWPRAVPGFLDFIELVKNSPDPIDTAVISAGHTEFIDRVYDLWGIERPDVYVTTETISQLGLDQHFMPSELAKPAPILMTIAKHLWAQKYGLPDTIPVNNEHILYVGDDPIKDGGLASNSGVDFVHIDPLQPEQSWHRAAKALQLGSYATKTMVAHD